MRWGARHQDIGDSVTTLYKPPTAIKQIPIYKQFDSKVEFDLLLSPTTLIVLFECCCWWEANKGGTWKHFFTRSYLIRVPKKETVARILRGHSALLPSLPPRGLRRFCCATGETQNQWVHCVIMAAHGGCAKCFHSFYLIKSLLSTVRVKCSWVCTKSGCN